jgi:transcription initiation factor IIE alpha subunit
MPLIAYQCECGHSEKKFMRQVTSLPASFVCPKCSKDMKKIMSSPSSGSKIVIDQPGMARRVEIVPDIIEINKARSEKDYSQD